MKIGFVISDSSLERGGERATITLANALSSHYEIVLLSLYQKNSTPFYHLKSGVELWIGNKGGVAAKGWAWFNQKRREFSFLKSVIRKSDIDVFIGVGTYCSVLLGFLTVFNRTKKYIAWEHANYAAASPLWKWLRNFFYPKLNALVCLNKSELAHYEEKVNFVRDIPNILGFHSIKKSERKGKLILSIGALEEEKGFDLLIDAFHRLNAMPDWTLIIIGEGSKQLELEEKILLLNLYDRVILKPYTRDIIGEYLDASMYVLSSRREGFGMVLIEAMECGLPCVAFDCPTGPANIIAHGDTGLLVKPLSSEALALMIERIAFDDNLAELLIDNAKKSIQKYDEGKIIQSWQYFFRNIGL